MLPLDVQRLTKAYGSNTVLAGVDISLAAGEPVHAHCRCHFRR